MKIFCSLLMLLIGTPAMAGGINFFQGSFDEALEEAKKSNKLLFVDAYADWCGPCKTMEKTVFVREEVGELFNDLFINYKLDIEDEDQNGPEISDKYGVEVLPTYLFVDSSGDLVSKKVGAMSTDTFMATAGAVVGRGGSEQLCKAYESGDRSIDSFLSCHAKKTIDAQALMEQGDDSALVALDEEYNKYYDSLSKEQLLSKDGFRLITNQAMLSRGTTPVEFMVDNYQQFANLVDPKLLATIAVEANKNGILFGSFQDQDSANQWVEDIRGTLASAYKLAAPNDKTIYQRSKLSVDAYGSMMEKNWGGFVDAKVAQAQLLEDKAEQQAALEEISREMLSFGCEDKEAFKSVLVYAKQGWQNSGNFDSALHYAGLLKAVGDSEKSKKMLSKAEKMIELESDTKLKETMQQQLAEANI
ncbi:thioredoxin family protein [Porticoccus sp. W117]|uniref:thioredoxin family protein n=1 Tax=Porticoccus sp. W117 TaxID=3054777 RepID=UPI00259717EE|nr:thioredoxin family protein [Porticoccus sp. W117]MDM3870464.1 thioredoxin family protein [Porticoccus sp. W117]